MTARFDAWDGIELWVKEDCPAGVVDFSPARYSELPKLVQLRNGKRGRRVIVATRQTARNDKRANGTWIGPSLSKQLAPKQITAERLLKAGEFKRATFFRLLVSRPKFWLVLVAEIFVLAVACAAALDAFLSDTAPAGIAIGVFAGVVLVALGNSIATVRAQVKP